MKLIKPTTLSGFMELLPGDQIAFNHMIKVIRETYELYGFQPIETPAIELAEILLAKGSGETDKQLYRFTKGKKDLALHFDLTVPLARYVSEHFSKLTFPFKRHQIQKVWRAERAQKGRFREFYQADIDVIGSYNPLFDAEIPKVIFDVFRNLQLDDFVIRINNRKILNGFFSSLKLTDQAKDLMREVDRIEKVGPDETQQNLVTVGASPAAAKAIIDFLQPTDDPIKKLRDLNIDDELFQQGVNELEAVVTTINTLGLPKDYYKVDLSIARGLDYYTGTVYETLLKKRPEVGSICSGGRYDDLAKYYSKENLPGVGISIGLTRLFSQLKELDLIKVPVKSTSQVMIMNLGEEMLPDYLVISKQLREKGINCEIYYDSTNFRKQMKYANSNNIPFVIFYGGSEKEAGKIKIKNMEKRKEAEFDYNDSYRDELIKFMEKI